MVCQHFQFRRSVRQAIICVCAFTCLDGHLPYYFSHKPLHSLKRIGEEARPLGGLGPVNEHAALAGRPGLIKNTYGAEYGAVAKRSLNPHTQCFQNWDWYLQSVLPLNSAQYIHGLLGVSLASLSDMHTEEHLCGVLTWCSTLHVSYTMRYLFLKVFYVAVPVTALLFHSL